MAGKVLDKMMGILGLEEDYDDIEEVEDDFREDDTIEPTITSSKRQGKVVNIHTAVAAKIILVKPQDYEEVTVICDNLKNRKIIVVNTTDLEPNIAQRFLDFMGGASYALAGNLSEVEKGVYILSPSNVEVANELKNELSNKGIMFNWNK